jgi:hypothetical protein
MQHLILEKNNIYFGKQNEYRKGVDFVVTLVPKRGRVPPRVTARKMSTRSTALGNPTYSVFSTYKKVKYIRDPGWVKKSGSESGNRILDEQPGSYFRELRNNFLG